MSRGMEQKFKKKIRVLYERDGIDNLAIKYFTRLKHIKYSEYKSLGVTF